MDRCTNPPKIGIIGAGFSGLCAAIQLRKRLGIDTFTLFDENRDVGGTWLINTYPGAACDIPSHLYSYSFEPNPNWSKAYSGQQEILEYLRNIARKYDLYPKIKFNHKVTAAEYDDKLANWNLTVLDKITGQENQLTLDILVSAIGALRVPNYPEQLEPFTGPKMHTAQWNSSIELKGKNVAIVGSGASAVQLIPEIVDEVKMLTVYIRHPAYVVPKFQHEFPGFVKWAFAHIPGVRWTLRNLIFWWMEMGHPAFKVDTGMSRLATRIARYHLNRQVRDPELRKKLTPDYQFGCKRVTPSNRYYPALRKKNVTVVTSPIKDVTADSIVNEDGTCEKPDMLILATGFRVQDMFGPMKITGKNGEDLLEKWKTTGPCAYAGITCHSAPNLFFLLGPNTGLGHNGILFIIECQVNWMIKAIREMTKRNARTVAVKKSAEERHMNTILTKLESTVWGATQCGSWYADHRGVVTAMYPDTSVAYHNLTKNVNTEHLEFS